MASDNILRIWFNTYFLSVYTPQANLPEADKERFYDHLQCARMWVNGQYNKEFGLGVGVHE